MTTRTGFQKRNEENRIHCRSFNGFTLVEMLAVIITLGLLAALLIPALARARPDNQALQCLENLRRMVLASKMYSGDFNDKLVAGGGGGSGYVLAVPTPPDSSPANPLWVQGRVSGTGTDTTNLLMIQYGKLFPYVKSVNPYKCPADPKRGFGGAPTIRSISVNCFLNPVSTSDTPPGSGNNPTADLGGGSISTRNTIFRKQSDLSLARPPMVWCFIDESPTTINDAWFIEDEFNYTNRWVDLPAAYHNGAAGLAFADGHAEMKRWSDSTVLAGEAGFSPVDPNSGDWLWFLQRTTVPGQ